MKARFTRPVRGLLPGRGPQDLGIALTPRLEGRWAWLDRSTVEFMASEQLKPGETVTIEAPVGLTAADGAILLEAARASYQASGVYLGLQSGPARDGVNQVWVDDPVELVFDDKLDKRTVASSVSLVEERGGQELPVDARLDVKGAQLAVRAPFKVGASYLLRVSPGLRGERGLALARGLTMRLAVPPTLEAALDCFEQDEVCGEHAATLRLTAPVRLSELRRALRVEPPVPLVLGDPDEPAGPRKREARVTSARVTGAFVPGTKYRFTLEKGSIKDPQGRPLASPLSATLAFSAEGTRLTPEGNPDRLRDPGGQAWSFSGSQGLPVVAAAARLGEAELWELWEKNTQEPLDFWQKHR